MNPPPGPAAAATGFNPAFACVLERVSLRLSIRSETAETGLRAHVRGAPTRSLCVCVCVCVCVLF